MCMCAFISPGELLSDLGVYTSYSNCLKGEESKINYDLYMCHS